MTSGIFFLDFSSSFGSECAASSYKSSLVIKLPREMSGGSCHISVIQVFSSRAEAIAHTAVIVFQLINSGLAVFTQILHSFFNKSPRVPSTRCGLILYTPAKMSFK